MPKKQFLEKPKKKSKAPQAPSTADEYLAAGVDFEEAGEKWRGGDAAKSTRFFIRALDCYDDALKKFPISFDLAYNKARLQYELTQHPKLLAQLPGSLLELLQAALDSSRYALTLKQDNADVLFNTAQVLTSIVEAISDSHNPASIDPIPLLEESLELFQRCLTLQELQHTESLAQEESLSQEPDNEDGGVFINQDASSTSSEPPQDDRWATILEPVTNDTLLDTLLAQLETLTALCGLINTDAGKGLAWVEEYASSLLTTKLPAYLSGTDRESEAGLTRANFMAAAADANFRFQRIDIGTYSRAIEEAYSLLDLKDNPEGLVNKAEAFISYNSSIRLYHYAEEASAAKDVLQSRWQALTTALNALTTASKIPSADNLPKIHLARGDVELLRFQLGQPPNNFDSAAKNAGVLVKNAEKFYRGAKALAGSQGAAKEGEEASIKEALAVGIGGDAGPLKEAIKVLVSTKDVLEDAIDDGLVTVDQLVAMGIA